MSQIIKPVMLDETGQETNTKLTELGGKVDSHKEQTAESLSELSSQVEATEEALTAVAEAIAAVHSVNGMTGNVVLDSSSIVLNKFNNSKTISQVLSEEQGTVTTALQTIQEAITRTPVSFSTSVIEEDEYLLTIALATP